MPAVSVQNLDKYEMVGGADREMARAEVSVKVNLLKMFRDVCPAEDIWVAYIVSLGLLHAEYECEQCASHDYLVQLSPQIMSQELIFRCVFARARLAPMDPCPKVSW